MENRDDFGYKVVGYVETEEIAKEKVKEAGNLRGDETWSLHYLPKPIPKMQYRAVMKLL